MAGRGEPDQASRAKVFIPSPSRARRRALEAAFNDYCHRLKAGEEVDPESYCEQFPDIKASLRLEIDIHHRLEAMAEHLPEAALLPGEWPLPGTRFLDYELLLELGRGTFSRVYLAEEVALGGRLVAVKVAYGGAGEAETLGRLTHPNIVPIHSARADQETGLTLVCMPYRGSATLHLVLDRAFREGVPSRADVIREAARDFLPAEPEDPGEGEDRDPWPAGTSYVAAVVSLGAQLADALAFMHGRGILHRDLKPSNVLVTPRGRPLLLDFNLAHDDRLTTLFAGGTLPYMSPEEIRAYGSRELTAWKALDGRSDLFSLGVILYELLTGVHPFGPIPPRQSEEELSEHLLDRQRQGPPPARNRNPQVDSHLEGVLRRCLAFAPEDRFASAEELAAALRSGLAMGRRRRRRGRRALLLAGAALALLVPAAILLPDRDGTHEKGRRAFLAGHYQEAAQYFGRELKADWGDIRAHVARARAYQRLGNWKAALADYTEAADRAPGEGHLQALRGYCKNKLQSREAAGLYQAALDEGYKTAAVYNNLGYSHLNRNQLTTAEAELNAALKLDDCCQAAYYNRALLRYQEALEIVPKGAKKAKLKETQQAKLQDGIKDIKQALRLGPRTGPLYRDAASLYAFAARSGLEPKKSLKQACACLARAVELGEKIENLEQQELLRGLLRDPRITEALKKAPRQPAPPQDLRLVDPAPDVQP